MIKIFLLMILVQLSLQNVQYGDSQLLSCTNDFFSNYESSDGKKVDVEVYLQNTLILHKIDQYVFVLLGPISLISTIFIILTFLRFPTIRQQPGGDILLGISVSDFFLCFNFITHGAYNFANNQGPATQDDFCQVFAFINTFFTLTDIGYNVLMCLFISSIMKQNLKGGQLKPLIYHSLLIGLNLIITIILQTSGVLGLGLQGVCAIRAYKSFPFYIRIICFLFIFYFWQTLAFFRSKTKYLRKKNKILKKTKKRKNAKNYIQFYVRYISLISLVWIIIAFCNLLSSMNCSFIHSPGLNVVITISNIFELIGPLILSIIRYNDPLIKIKIRQLFKLKNSNENSENIINPLEKLIFDEKKMQIFTIFVGLNIALQKPLLEKTQVSDKIKNQELSFSEQFEFLQQHPVRKCELTMLNPDIFSKIRAQDNELEELYQSFDIMENTKFAMKQGGKGGGKSGEFMIFTHDKQFLIKTMKLIEYDTLKEKVQDYCNYLENNENTLVNKILGVFTFTFTSSEKVTIFIQKSLILIPKQFIISVSDLKGSQLDRNSFDINYDPSAEEIRQTILKDNDFLRVEQTIQLHWSTYTEFCKQVQSDAELFEVFGWIDYSLLIFKINLFDYCCSINITVQEYLDEKSDELGILKSVDQPGIYYIVGIIDYLQYWDIGKKFESGYKNIRHRSLTASAQSPDFYSHRFIESICQRYFTSNKWKQFLHDKSDDENLDISKDVQEIELQILN